jgi:multidrug resistance efflux pump
MKAPRTKVPLAALAAAALAALAAGCGPGEVEAPKPRPRPIAVVELKEIDPVGKLQITGTVQSWKENDVAFEVGGTVDFVVESATNLEGRWEQGGEVKVEGEVLARLDTRLFEIKRDSAKASVLVAEENLRLANVQLAEVLPAQVEGAKADMDRAEAEYRRVKAAYERDAMSEIDFIRARADRDGTIARHKESLAQIETQKANIESLKAQIREAEANLDQAQYDLDRCVLYAPFSGQVSTVYVEAGGYANASQPIAHLIMMDPIQVDVAVSQETAARIQVNDRVTLFLPGVEREFAARVHEKATVADERTRTFRVSLLARNGRRVGALRSDDPLLNLPRVRAVSRLIPRDATDPGSRRFVEETHQLRTDAEGAFVWVAEGLSADRPIDPERPVIKVQKVRVVPGTERANYQGLYVLRRLDDVGALTLTSWICWDAPDGLKDGDEVLVGDTEWHLLPGQFVRVMFGTQPPDPGHYLPMSAIKKRKGGAASVFVAHEGKAREVPVRLGRSVGELYHVEPMDDAGAELLKDGAQVAARHVHFLVDGETVRVTQHEEIVP